MSDIFQEVSDDLRREKFEVLWKKFGSAFLAVAIVLVLSTAGWSFYSTQTAKASARDTSSLIAATKSADAEKLLAFASEARASQATLARLLAAAQLVEKGETEKALTAYDDIIKTPGADASYADLARVLRAGLEMDQEKADLDAIAATLKKIDAGKNPWRFSAREHLGLIAAQKKDFAAAVAAFESISSDEDAPPGVRARAVALMQLYASQTTKEEPQKNEG